MTVCKRICSIILKQTLYCILVVQFAILPIPKTQADPIRTEVYTGDQTQARLRSVAQAMLHMTTQDVRVYEPGSDTPTRTSSLTDVDLLLDPPRIQSLGQLQISHVADELRIRYTDGTRTYEHAIGEVGTLTAPLLRSGNFLVEATEKGLLVLPIHLLQGQLFTAPLPLLRLTSLPVGSKITRIQSLNIDTQDHQKWLTDFDGKQLVFDGDLLIDVERSSESGELETQKIFIPRDRMITAIRDQLITFLVMNEILNRAEGSSPFLMSILEQHQSHLLQSLREDAGGIEETLGAREQWVEEALRRFSPKGRGILERALAPGFNRVNGETTESPFDKAINSPRRGQSIDSLAQDPTILHRAAESSSTELTQTLLAKSWAFMMDSHRMRQIKSSLTNAINYTYGVLTSKWAMPLYGAGAITAGLTIGDPEATKTAALGLLAYGTEIYSTIAGIELTSAQVLAGTNEVIQQSIESYFNANWFAATIGVISTLGLVLGLARLIGPKGSDKGWFQRTFEMGASVLARLNNMIPKLLEGGLKQQLLYPSLAAGLRPEFTAPNSTDAQIEERVMELRRQINNRDMTQQLASYVAAAIASSHVHPQKAKGTGGEEFDPGFLVFLDQLRQGALKYQDQGVEGKTITMLELLEDKDVQLLWDRLHPVIYEVMWNQIQAEDAGDKINEVAFRVIKERFDSIQEEIAHIQRPDISTLIRDQWRRTQRFVRTKVVNYVLGGQFREFSKQWRHPHFNKNTVRAAAYAMGPDFIVSMLMFAVLFPDTMNNLSGFLGGSIGVAALTSVARERLLLPVSMAFEQVLLGSAVLPIGAAQGRDAADLSEPEFASSVSSLLEEPKLQDTLRQLLLGGLTPQQKTAERLFGDPNAIPQQRTQPFWNGTSQIVQSMVKHPGIYLNEHAHYIEKFAGSAIPGILLLTAPFIGISFATSAGLALGWEGLNPVNFTAAVSIGLLSNFSILLAKYSFAGYAWVWPYAHTMTHLGFEHLDLNQRAFIDMLYWMEFGLRGQNPQALAKGVQKLQGLFETGKVNIPGRFAKSSGDFTPELAKEFLLYSFQKENMPVPTLANKKLAIGLINTVILSGLTTVLYTQLYSDVLSLSSVFHEQGTQAAILAFNDFLINWAILPLLGTYMLTKFGPQITSKPNLQKMAEAARNSWRRGRSAGSCARAFD